MTACLVKEFKGHLGKRWQLPLERMLSEIPPVSSGR